MKTRVCRIHRAGDLRIETEGVTPPGAGEVLVRVAAGGICGSDLHYFHDGGFGPVRVREPMILGHEASGVVIAVGAGVGDLAPGQRVAINPSRPCGTCDYCERDLPIHCLDMRFRGSAMRLPHEQGLFRDLIVLGAGQCLSVADDVDLGELACSEPLAVCLHARGRAGDLTGKRVLITGAGPIGALCTAAALDGGAKQVVVTDLEDAALATARRMGAHETVNVASAPGAMEQFRQGKGHFDVVFECSAAMAAITMAIEVVKPRGTIVQVGVTGDLPVPINMIVGKEIHYLGSQRFHAEFAEAVEAIATRRIDVRPIITGSYPLENAQEAFRMAGDRSRAVKVHLTFSQATET